MYQSILLSPGPSSCGGFHSEREGLIQHASYPLRYDNNLDICVAHLVAAPGTGILLEVLLFDIESSRDCEFDVVEVG